MVARPTGRDVVVFDLSGEVWVGVPLRIFAAFLAGKGYYAIAEELTAEGIPSPSAHDQVRNAHRPGFDWGKSSVRTILLNPRYTGYQVGGRQHRNEVLLDIADMSAGYQTVQRWNTSDPWV